MDSQEIPQDQLKDFSIGGAKSSPIDYRQINLSHIAGAAAPVTAPLNIVIDYSKVPDLYQRKIGACTNHAFVALAMHRELRLKGAATLLSPRFTYTMSKCEDNIGLVDQGTFSIMPFKMAVKYGIATDAVVPNDTTLDFPSYVYNVTPGNMPAHAFTDADLHRIPGYVQVGKQNNVQIADLAQALTHEPDGVLIQIPVGMEFYTSQYGVQIPKGQSSWFAADIFPIAKVVNQIDDHDVVVFALITEPNTGRVRVYFRNSWSPQWGAPGIVLTGEPTLVDCGWFYFDEHTIHEAWTISEIPDALLQIVKSLPSQATFKHTFTKSLTPGMTDPDVMQLQIALKIIGTFPFNQPVTNYFGPITVAAVKAWQSEHNVATPQQIADAAGAVGPKSLAVLNKEFSHQ